MSNILDKGKILFALGYGQKGFSGTPTSLLRLGMDIVDGKFDWEDPAISEEIEGVRDKQEIAKLKQHFDDDQREIQSLQRENIALKEKIGRGCPIDGYEGRPVIKERDDLKFGRVKPAVGEPKIMYRAERTFKDPIVPIKSCPVCLGSIEDAHEQIDLLKKRVFALEDRMRPPERACGEGREAPKNP